MEEFSHDCNSLFLGIKVAIIRSKEAKTHSGRVESVGLDLYTAV